jgi:hypothetical protein
MMWTSDQAELHADDSDFHKGAIEGPPDGYGNRNAQGPLDELGLPINRDAVAEDVMGANEDETQG